MSKLVIVAIPEQDDFVWQVSSEKVPHITLLFLGDADANQNSQEIVEFVEHAATMISPFYMDADHRGTLGEDDADVIFFEKGWDFKAVSAFRDQLLTNTHIKQAYNSVEQFPEWQPHLTLGYPETPAKTPEEEHGTRYARRIHSVSFDRIGVWFGDSEGPEFRLKHKVHEDMAEVGMSSMSREEADELLHYGVKGMKWGKRMGDARSSLAARNAAARAPKEVVVTTSNVKGKAQIQTKKGQNQPAHQDAITAKAHAQKRSKSGINSMSNKELQELASRMSLEQRVQNLSPTKVSFGKKAVDYIMANPQESTMVAKEGQKIVTTAIRMAKAK